MVSRGTKRIHWCNRVGYTNQCAVGTPFQGNSVLILGGRDVQAHFRGRSLRKGLEMQLPVEKIHAFEPVVRQPELEHRMPA